MLTFAIYINKRLKNTRVAEARIRGLTKSYMLPSGLVQKIEISAVQTIAFFGAEIWWHGQKEYEEKLEKLLNKQAQAITSIYQSTPVGLLMSMLGLVPARMMLDYCQRKYALQLLTLPNDYWAKNILSITLRVGDRNLQTENLLEDDGIWATYQKVRNYRQHLARQVSVQFCIDLVDGVELVVNLRNEKLSGRISIQKPTVVILEAQRDNSDLALWSDESKLELRKVGATVV